MGAPAVTGERCMDCDTTAGILVSLDVWGEPDVRWLCVDCCDEWMHPTRDTKESSDGDND